MLLLAATTVLQSCDNDDDNYYAPYVPNAIVTLKTNPTSGVFFMQLDDATTLVPTNVSSSPYGDKEVRALVNFRYTADDEKHASRSIYVNWMDTIRTKNMANDMGEANDKTYGTDPIEILNDWTTVVEDGYLTIRFSTYFGTGKIHSLNLVKGDGDYEVAIHHDANGDTRGHAATGLIAFRLDQLPNTEGKTVDLKVTWDSFSGKKSATFKYCSRQ